MNDKSRKIAKPSMRYISKLEYGAWYVRVPEISSKTFSWKEYGGKRASLNFARKWRNKKCKKAGIKIGKKKEE